MALHQVNSAAGIFVDPETLRIFLDAVSSALPLDATEAVVLVTEAPVSKVQEILDRRADRVAHAGSFCGDGCHTDPDVLVYPNPQTST